MKLKLFAFIAKILSLLKKSQQEYALTVIRHGDPK